MEIPKQWQMEADRLARVFEFADFAAAMVFVNQVAVLSEAANHHPDILVRWNKVRLELWTHTAGAVTEQDRELAERINML